MKAAGIGGALIGNINPKEKDGKVPMLSEAWWNLMVHAVNEGKRVGVDIGVFNCPGWSQSGGPWIKPEMTMRYLTYSETQISGGENINIKLEKPTKNFQDTYVLAFPSISSEKNFLSSDNTVISTKPSIKSGNNIIDRDTTTLASFFTGNQDYQVDFFSDKNINAQSLKIIHN